MPAAGPELEWVFYASRPGPAIPGLDLTVLPGNRLWSQTRLPLELWQRRPDLFFAPSHVVPYLAPGRTLTVVHDLAFERFPDAYRSFDRWYLRRTTRWALRRCLLVLAVSESTRRDLVELYGADPERVVVVHPGATPPPARLRVREARLTELGLRPTSVQDRKHFHSVYFRMPDGMLIEIATDGPGFLVDEPAESLGQGLALPPWLEVERATLERELAPIG